MVATDDESANEYNTPLNGSKDDVQSPAFYSASEGPESNPETDEEKAIDQAGDNSYLAVDAKLQAGLPLDNSRFDSCGGEYAHFSQRGNYYCHKKGWKKYSEALQTLIPIRKTKAKKNLYIPVDDLGLFSFTFYSWLTQLMWKVYRKGLLPDEVPHCSPLEGCHINCQRMQYLWQKEVDKKGPEAASLHSVVWQFMRTRMLLTLSLFIISLVAGFLGPTIFMRKLLEYAQKSEVSHAEGLIWLTGLFSMEIFRVLLFACMWAINYRTALRLRSGCLAMLYCKVMRLKNLGDKSIGEFINLFVNDGSRIFEFVTYGPLIVGGPIVAIGGTIFIGCLLGPAALAGMATFILFYPFQYLISRLTGYFRRKTIKVTDERVRFVNEMLTCVKLIKLYAWEKPFAKSIAAIRNEERKLLEKAAYVQSTSIAMAPTVPIIAAIITFLAHIGAGNNLTPAEAFTVIGSYTAIRYTFAIIPYSVASIVDMLPSLKRMKAFSVIGAFKVAQMAMAQLPNIVRTFIDMGRSTIRMKAFSIIATLRVVRPQLIVFSNGTKALVEGVILFRRIKAFSVMGLNVVIRGQFVNFTMALRAYIQVVVSSIRYKAFTVMTILNILNFSIRVVPLYANEIVNGRIAFRRFQSVLLMEDQQSYAEKPENENEMVSITKATFVWDAPTKTEKNKQKTKKVKHDKKLYVNEDECNNLKTDVDFQNAPTLSSINFKLKRGELIGICGSVGCGKSSMIGAILGQLRLLSGNVAFQGTVAYVAQQAWIINASIKENILFGEPYDPKRYYEAIFSCGLTHDISSFPAGDETEIGERGVNLSGGQKQRVSLARAVYSNRDIYLLDDPLSAVDAHVGKHIYEYCIKGALKGKSIVFVTHQLQFLNTCDCILLMKDGRIVEQGTHAELIKEDGEYANLIRTFHNEDENLKHIAEDNPLSSIVGGPLQVNKEELKGRPFTLKNVIPNQAAVADPKAGKLINEEKLQQGNIDRRTYFIYMKAAGGYFISSIVLMFFILNIGTTAFSSWWLSRWIHEGSGNTEVFDPVSNITRISDSITDNPNLETYQLVYGLSIILILLTSFIRSFLFMKATLRASSWLHDKVFMKIFYCPMSFFDSTPVGRIINLFARDMDEIDVRLPFVAETFLQNVWVIIFSLLFVTLVFPWFLIPLAVLCIIFFILYKIFRVAIRELKRIENMNRSPIYSHVTASIQGLSTIHAYQKEEKFIKSFMFHMDNNTSPFFLFNCAMRWLALRLDVLVVSITIITGLFVVLMHGQVSAAYAGLALAYAAQLTGLFQYTVRLSTETEARFTSVERMYGYLQNSDSEAPAIIEKSRPSADWPKQGRIKFTRVCMKYRSHLPIVLKSISFIIEPREKVGIVGRTGSGKSSLGAVLFRLVELTSGTIYIDEFDISTIGLEDLRSKMSLIPQDPILFIGTVRYNLDPFDLYSDEDIWKALEKTYMKNKIMSLEKQLTAPVVENGENFSVGERQLLCMARALLRNSKILLMDEATAAIDTETDALIQTTIKEAFAHCTILTIAHRLNTVLSSDRVMVLQDGEVKELDKPSVLMSQPNSIFSSMMTASETMQIT